MNNDYKEQCWKRYLENQKYEKYDKEDLVDEIMELQQENQQLKKERASIMTSLTTSREKYNNDKARYRRKYKNLKKQKDDVVEYIKNNMNYYYDEDLEESIYQDEISGNEVLRMLGETDE